MVLGLQTVWSRASQTGSGRKSAERGQTHGIHQKGAGTLQRRTGEYGKEAGDLSRKHPKTAATIPSGRCYEVNVSAAF